MTTMRMVASVAILVVAVATGGAARAGDPFPYFLPDPKPAVSTWLDPFVEYGPELAHAVATECGETDRKCIGEHDDRVLTLALMMGSPGMCERATRVEACGDAYQMTTGDIPSPGRWAGLDDGCTFVMSVDTGVASLYSPRTGERRRARMVPGWRQAAFIGACDLSTFTADRVTVEPLAPWVAR